MGTGLRRRNLKKRDQLQDKSIAGRITPKCMLQIQDGKAWAGLVWLRTGTSGVLV
jgi:hypothetical protein